jgi:dimethylamine corrinoid protein
MKKVVDLLNERNLREERYVILGGGPTTMTVRDYVGADAWSLDPKTGVNMCRDFVEGKKG